MLASIVTADDRNWIACTWYRERVLSAHLLLWIRLRQCKRLKVQPFKLIPLKFIVLNSLFRMIVTLIDKYSDRICWLWGYSLRFACSTSWVLPDWRRMKSCCWWHHRRFWTGGSTRRIRLRTCRKLIRNAGHIRPWCNTFRSCWAFDWSTRCWRSVQL